MVMVRTNKELSHENTEVLSCHFHLHHPYSYGGETERSWKLWCENALWPSDWCSVPALSSTVPMGCLTGKSNDASTLQSTLSYAGENAMNNKVWTVYRIDHVRVDRPLFPPQQQHSIVALATQPPQQRGHPITHWSMTDLTRAVIQEGIVELICPATIWRLLDQAAIKPHRWHYWLNSPDPDFHPKMYDIVELYLNALKMYERGDILLSVDEKTSIQALERKYPHKPMMLGRVELIEHEYKRHGTCCLTAGLEVATGEVMGLLTPNRPAEVFAEFIQWICQTYAEARSIHIVMDNLNTHYHALTCQVVADFCQCTIGPIETGRQRRDFLADPSKRIIFHFTPSHASWLNQIEIWFSTLVRKVIRRGDFSSVDDLQDKIIRFIEYYNEHLAKPYKWTYTGKPLAAGKKVA
jgi:transposase